MNEVDPGDEALDVLPIDAAGRRRRRTTPARRTTGRSTRWILTGIAALVLSLVGANLLLGGDDDTEEAAAPEELVDEIPADAVEADAIDPLAGVPVGYSGLLEGQYLRHAPTGLPGSVETVTVMCRVTTPPGALTDLDSCDSGTAQRGTTSPAGRLEIGFQVYRTINTGRAGDLDCVLGGCELRTYSDRVAGVAARVPLDFEMVRETTTPPTFRVEFDTQLSVGANYIVIGEGFPAETSIHIRPCRMAIDPDPFACDWVLEDRVIQTDADGTFRHTGVADWEIGFGDDGIACDEIPAGICAMNVSIPGAPRQPAAVPLEFSDFGPDFSDVELPEAIVVEPATGLVDGQSVAVSTDGVAYDGEFGLFQCIVATPGDCTWVDFFGEVTDGVYDLPRSFVTWRGTRHDCAVDGACMLSIFVFAQSVDRVDVPIEFDPEQPLRPANSASASPTTDLESGQIVTVEFEESISFPLVAICATGDARLCQALGVSADQGTLIGFRVRSDLVTPVGSHDCLRDGPCEITIWNGAGFERFEPIPIEFRPEVVPELTLTARPATGLEHADTVQVTVSGIRDDRPSVQICVQGTLDCWFAASIDVRDGKGITQIPVAQRILVFRSFTAVPEVVDCAVVVCELRVSEAQVVVNAPLEFAVGATPTTPELAIEAQYADRALPYDTPIEVRGRGFLPVSNDFPISVQLCTEGDLLSVACVSVGSMSSADIAADGTFTTRILLERIDFGAVEDDSLTRCESDCELVITNGYGEPARLPVRRTP